MEQVQTKRELPIAEAGIARWRARVMLWQQAMPRWAFMLGAGVIAVVIVVSHRPDALFNPQFLNEDGKYYYADAYNLGLIAPFYRPVSGYLILSARLIALVAVHFPLRWGPAIFNLFAIFFHALPAVFLLSRRFDRLLPSWPARLFLAFFYLVAPNSFELDATVTNMQWHLALLAFMLVIAEPPSLRLGRVRDGGLILLTGLSTPICFVLVPIIALHWWHTRSRWTLTLLAADVAASLIQGVVLLTIGMTQRQHIDLGAHVSVLARIITGQVFLAGSLGMNWYAAIAQLKVWETSWFPVLLACVGLAYTAYAAWKGPIELRLFLLYGALVIAAVLVSPVEHRSGWYWASLAHPRWNMRYEFLAILGWAAVQIAILANGNRVTRYAAVAVLCLFFMIGIPSDWRYPPMADQHYGDYITRFEHMHSGQSIVIPIGWDWTMTLTKH
jgi:hypothetical protein